MNQFTDRKYIIILLIIGSSLLFAGKLFFMQVIDDTYAASAESNSRRDVIQYPARGLIFDRNGELIVSNQAAYDVMLIPRHMKEMDTLEFCKRMILLKE